MISIDINLTNLNLMTRCVWTAGISHGPQKRDEADCRSASTGNPLLSNFGLLKKKKTPFLAAEYAAEQKRPTRGDAGGWKEVKRQRGSIPAREKAAAVPLLPSQVAFLMDGPISSK